MQVSQTASDFADLGLDPIVLDAVHGLGYRHPTPIQREAIPAGRDLIATAIRPGEGAGGD